MKLIISIFTIALSFSAYAQNIAVDELLEKTLNYHDTGCETSHDGFRGAKLHSRTIHPNCDELPRVPCGLTAREYNV